MASRVHCAWSSTCWSCSSCPCWMSRIASAIIDRSMDFRLRQRWSGNLRWGSNLRWRGNSEWRSNHPGDTPTLSWYNLVSPPLSMSASAHASPPPSTSAHLHPCPPTSINVHLPSATTLKHTCSVLAQLCCTYCQTNFGSRPNMSGPSSHAKGHHTYALFPICPTCLIPLHWQ